MYLDDLTDEEARSDEELLAVSGVEHVSNAQACVAPKPGLSTFKLAPSDGPWRFLFVLCGRTYRLRNLAQGSSKLALERRVLIRFVDTCLSDVQASFKGNVTSLQLTQSHLTHPPSHNSRWAPATLSPSP